MTSGESRWERWAPARAHRRGRRRARRHRQHDRAVLPAAGPDEQAVENAQARSANLSNADREVLVLLQVVTQLGVDTDPQEIDVHRVAGRQIGVSIASFDPDDPRVRELHDVRERLAAFPWDRLADTRGRDDVRCAEAMALVGQSEERINTCAASRRRPSTRSPGRR